LGQHGGEPLALDIPQELRQHLEGQGSLDPEQLREELEEEVARVAQRGRHAASLLETRLSFSRPARRSDSAMITSAGFASPSVGKTLPSATKRFGTSQARWLESTTLSSGEKPMRHPPTR